MSVVTFLFTDIEGSTRRWEADPDAMRVALEAHNEVIREAVKANDGKVFNYTGDGMCAVFASPRSAVGPRRPRNDQRRNGDIRARADRPCPRGAPTNVKQPVDLPLSFCVN
jgi:class 3 adenylate cyclase